MFGVANIAAVRGVNLTEVTFNVEGELELPGIHGLTKDFRNGYQQIKATFNLKGDDPEKLRQVVEQSRQRSVRMAWARFRPNSSVAAGIGRIETLNLGARPYLAASARTAAICAAIFQRPCIARIEGELTEE